MKLLLDSCVISELVRPEPHPGVSRFVAECDMRDIRLSVLVIAELRRGCLILPEGRRRRELEAATASLLEGLRARVLPVDLETALIWSRVSASCRRAGRTIQVVDGLIAATALRHDAALVTRNVRDFEATGVRLINPWSDAP